MDVISKYEGEEVIDSLENRKAEALEIKEPLKQSGLACAIL